MITRIKSVIADSGLTSNAFALKVGMNSSNLSRKLNGKVPITSRDYRLICDSIGVNKDWLETGAGDKYVGEPLNGKETMQSVLGVPFYDVEFALGYDEMYNDTPNVPTKFISIPGYEKADFWCRASGDSMKPIISNGDIIALKAVDDWQSFLPMNEVYAIMTANGQDCPQGFGRCSLHPPRIQRGVRGSGDTEGGNNQGVQGSWIIKGNIINKNINYEENINDIDSSVVLLYILFASCNGKRHNYDQQEIHRIPCDQGIQTIRNGFWSKEVQG